MVGRGFALVVTGCVWASSANAYQWMGTKHACFVEHSSYAAADGSGLGKWSNAPKTFFIKLQNCVEYAEDKGLPYAHTDTSKAGISLEELKINSCVTTKGGEVLSLILVEGLRVGFPEPVDGFSLKIFPQASAGGTMTFGDDGFVNFSQYGATADDEDAWFMLRAHCTSLD